MAIFKPEMKESTGGNKFTGICKFAIINFEDKSGMFDWADLYLDVEVKQEHSDYSRKLQIKGSFEKDSSGNITGGIWNNAANAGTLIPGEEKCRRDLGIVVDAVAQDLWFGGNEFTIAATKEYFNGNQLLANGLDVTKEVTPAISAFKRAEELMQRALTNTYYDRDLNITLDQTGDPPIVGNIECDAHDMVLDNKEFIAK